MGAVVVLDRRRWNDAGVVRPYPHIVPPITDPLGQYWEQPDRYEIEIDVTHALMSRATFERLLDYTGSQPTGVYPGKMWRVSARTWTAPELQAEFQRMMKARVQHYADLEAHDKAIRDFADKHTRQYWVLCWYGYCRRHPLPCERCCSNNYREILIV